MNNMCKKNRIITLIVFCLLMLGCGDIYSKEKLPQEIEDFITSLEYEMIGVPDAFMDCLKQNIRKDFKEALKTKTFTPYENRYGSEAYLRQAERQTFMLEVANKTINSCMSSTSKLSPDEIKTTF